MTDYKITIQLRSDNATADEIMREIQGVLRSRRIEATVGVTAIGGGHGRLQPNQFDFSKQAHSTVTVNDLIAPRLPSREWLLKMAAIEDECGSIAVGGSLPTLIAEADESESVAKIDLDRLNQLREQGHISSRKHPEYDLWIHNYTARCQYESAWNELSLQCRGLITDTDGNIVARPFQKFFNLHEHTPESGLPEINWNQPYSVSEKMDGSLGIVYKTPHGPRIATRGSFESEQAEVANKLLNRRKADFCDGFTYLFEIIYPENRIVVNYDREMLVLIEMIHTETGCGVHRYTLATEAERLGFTVVSEATIPVDSDESTQNREGVVVRFEDGLRVKIKFAEYCRLHKLVTGASEKSIWECLSSGTSLDRYLEDVPDEFYGWIRECEAHLRLQFAATKSEAASAFSCVQRRLGDGSRKEYAAAFAEFPELRSILFLMLDGKPYDHLIWKLIEPNSAVRFWKGESA